MKRHVPKPGTPVSIGGEILILNRIRIKSPDLAEASFIMPGGNRITGPWWIAELAADGEGWKHPRLGPIAFETPSPKPLDILAAWRRVAIEREMWDEDDGTTVTPALRDLSRTIRANWEARRV